MNCQHCKGSVIGPAYVTTSGLFLHRDCVAAAQQVEHEANIDKARSCLQSALTEHEEIYEFVRSAEHGTVQSYRRGCKCKLCKAANTAYHREYRAGRIPKRTPAAKHGNVGGYCNRKCRCDLCRCAWATYKRGLRESQKL